MPIDPLKREGSHAHPQWGALRKNHISPPSILSAHPWTQKVSPVRRFQTLLDTGMCLPADSGHSPNAAWVHGQRYRCCPCTQAALGASCACVSHRKHYSLHRDCSGLWKNVLIQIGAGVRGLWCQIHVCPCVWRRLLAPRLPTDPGQKATFSVWRARRGCENLLNSSIFASLKI